MFIFYDYCFVKYGKLKLNNGLSERMVRLQAVQNCGGGFVVKNYCQSKNTDFSSLVLICNLICFDIYAKTMICEFLLC